MTDKTTKTAPKKEFKPIQYGELNGIAQYAFLHRPDPGSPENQIAPAFRIDLMLPDEAERDKATNDRLQIFPADEKHPHPYVKIKSKVKEGRKAPRVVDSKRNDIPNNILVGNGSAVKVKYMPWEYGKGKVTAVLVETMVIKLVKYEPKENTNFKNDQFLDPVEGGFVVETSDSDDEPVA